MRSRLQSNEQEIRRGEEQNDDVGGGTQPASMLNRLSKLRVSGQIRVRRKPLVASFVHSQCLGRLQVYTLVTCRRFLGHIKDS